MKKEKEKTAKTNTTKKQKKIVPKDLTPKGTIKGGRSYYEEELITGKK